MLNTDPGPAQRPPPKKLGKRDTVSEIIDLLTKLNQAIKQEGKGLSRRLREISLELDRKIPYLDGHSGRVADVCLAVGREMQLSADEEQALEIGALLHDFGKIGVEEEILKLERRLSPEERKEVEEHVMRGYYILNGFPEISKALRGVKEHHEHWDGRGYPGGLKGENICIQARIISVVDAYDAMVTDRPYRQKLSQNEALFRLKECASRQFDPHVVDSFAKLVKRGEVK